MILLDTDVLIEVLRRGIAPHDWAISVITLIEFLRGLNPSKISEVKKRLEKAFTVIPLTDEVIETYCKLYGTLKEKGTLIPDADLLIAATSIALKVPLATVNTKRYSRLKEHGLKLVVLPELGISIKIL